MNQVHIDKKIQTTLKLKPRTGDLSNSFLSQKNNLLAY
jgi:hypothetical protein